MDAKELAEKLQDSERYNGVPLSLIVEQELVDEIEEKLLELQAENERLKEDNELLSKALNDMNDIALEEQKKRERGEEKGDECSGH